MNADDVAYLGADGTPLSYNLFAYCKNNPVNFSDDSGTWPKWATKVLIGVAVIAVAAVLTVATAGTGTALACFAAGALYGSVTGAAVGVATGAVTGAVTHRIQTGSWQGAGDAALNAAADGFMGGAVSGFIVGGLSSPVCFIAGTAILTATGSVNIEDIEAGDYVWASNPETGEVALKQVVQTFVNETNEFIHLVVDEEEITCTTEHPIYSPVKGWIAACELRAGDILVTVNGEYVVVELVEHEILENPVTVYNFEVEDFHTYYVGDTNVLVHNRCTPDRVINVSKSESSIWKGLKNAKNGLKTSGSGRSLNYYSWDNLHNEIEVFDRFGRHLGVLDPSTGRWIKEAVKGRWLKL